MTQEELKKELEEGCKLKELIESLGAEAKRAVLYYAQGLKAASVAQARMGAV